MEGVEETSQTVRPRELASCSASRHFLGGDGESADVRERAFRRGGLDRRRCLGRPRAGLSPGRSGSSALFGASASGPFAGAVWIVGVVWGVRERVLGRWPRALGVVFENVE